MQGPTIYKVIDPSPSLAPRIPFTWWMAAEQEDQGCETWECRRKNGYL